MAIIYTIAISLFIIALIGWTFFVSAVPLLFLLGTIFTILVIGLITFFVGFAVYAVRNQFKQYPICYYDSDDYFKELKKDIVDILNKKRRQK